METRGSQKKETVWTLADTVTLLRIPAAILTVWALHFGRWYALGGIFVIGLTDFLDGRIARRFGLVTDLGGMLDGLIDKLTALIVVLGFAYHGLLEPWHIPLFLTRDLLVGIGVGLLALFRIRRPHYRSRPLGKMVSWVQVFTVIAALFEFYTVVFVWCIFGLSLAAVTDYGLQALRESEKGEEGQAA